MMRNLLRSLMPQFALNWYRKRKKEQTRKSLDASREAGNILTKEELKRQIEACGIQSGDAVLVHSSLSKIGYVENGPATVIEAFLEAVGPNGHILMPNSPNASLQLDYVRNLDIFDIRMAASRLGAITEVFRNWPGALRSESATEPVSCIGPNAKWFVEGHAGETTPYTNKSPFYRLVEAKGKIVYLGVTLDNAGTSLHLLEDAVDDFPYPVYYKDEFTLKLIDENGMEKHVTTKVHNPEQSKLRKCDGLLPDFLALGVYAEHKIGNARTLVFDAEKMFDTMVRLYREKGVTMYTPNGTR